MPSMMMPKRPNPIEAYTQQLFQMMYQKKIQDEQYARQREESKTRYDWEADKERRREEALQRREDAAIRKADLMLKAKEADAKTKTTLGTAYTNKEGKLVRPVFDYQNKFIRDEEIGTPAIKDPSPPTTVIGALLAKLPPNHTAGDIMKIYRDTQKDPSLTEITLTKKALEGDTEAKSILASMLNRKITIAKAQGEAMVGAKIDSIVDVQGTARAIIEGREILSNVRNTFGVPIQENIRKEVLKTDPNFNFAKPELKYKSIQSSLTQQQKQRGMMGSFVNNLNKQISRVDTVMNDVISRVGVRALDLPLREFRTRFVGSPHERVLEAYLIEISNEIGKLSTGSAASIRELSTDAQERWAKIHDPNLSIKGMKTILDETQLMGNMRLESTDEEIEETLNLLNNIREPRESKAKQGNQRFRIITVK